MEHGYGENSTRTEDQGRGESLGREKPGSTRGAAARQAVMVHRNGRGRCTVYYARSCFGPSTCAHTARVPDWRGRLLSGPKYSSCTTTCSRARRLPSGSA